MRPAHAVIALAAVVGALVGSAPPDVVASAPALTSFSVSGTPFAESFAPLPTNATLTAVLSARARVTVTIRRLNGTVVRRLARGVSTRAGAARWSWDGRNDSGVFARDGDYVARVTAITSAGTQHADRPVRKGLPQIYPAAPGALVVVVDPGHGGRFPGAVLDGYMEKDFNLAIALQLRALLVRAGVQVVMTRSTDVAVNDPPSDANGDGFIDRYDDDLERNDIANLALADVAVHVHNNAAVDSTARGTRAYTDPDRTWTLQGRQLAAGVVAGVAGTLASYQSATFQPVNGGVRTGWYYYMGPYDPPFLIRAALMTSVLSESLFVSNSQDLEALKRPDIQLAIAAGIYLGVAKYLNERQYGIGYELVSGPANAAAGADVAYQVRVTNRGNATSAGWALTLATVPAVPLYDGSGAPGTELGRAQIPDGLGPGQSAVVTVNGVAPASADDWLVKTDVMTPGDQRLTDAGVAPLQFALATTIGP